MVDPSETSEASETSSGQSEPASAETAHEQPTIDVEALAEKVYRLMMAEIRLDRARGLASSDGG